MSKRYGWRLQVQLGGGECTSDIRVGVALDVGGLGDNGFNDLSKVGLDKAIAEGVVCQENTKFLEANSEGTNLDEHILSLAEEGFDAIVSEPGSPSRKTAASTRSRPTIPTRPSASSMATPHAGSSSLVPDERRRTSRTWPT